MATGVLVLTFQGVRVADGPPFASPLTVKGAGALLRAR